MPLTLTRVETPPEWIQNFSDEIDSLRFGPGFEKVDEDTEPSFGVHIVRGEADVKPKGKDIARMTVPFVWIFSMDPNETTRLTRIDTVNGPLRTKPVL